jgi:hypothetical protein
MRWRRSTPGNMLPGFSEERVLRAGRDYVGSAFPNPDRVGCPGRQRLEVFARQPSAPGENDVDHLMTCSACFVEYHAIRKAWKRRKVATIGALVAAALVLIVSSGVVISRRHPEATSNAPPKRPVEMAQEQVRNALIDLRPFERSRGESANNARGHPSPPVLDRANLLVTILLPVGSPQGPYVFQLLDSTGSSQVETSCNAAIKDYITTAVTPFDLRAVSAGRFTLTVRHAGEVTSASYTVEVR